MSQTLRQFSNIKKTNENPVDETISSSEKKQFGLRSTNIASKSPKNNNDLGLKAKLNTQKEELYKITTEKKKLQKSTSLIPQKRTESAVGLKIYSDTKKQYIQSVEKTYRHREQEIEWAPEGLDLDFSAFDSNLEESNYAMKEEMFDTEVEQDLFPIAQRRFTGEPLEEASIAEDLVAATEEYDTSQVEYCPPKEIEIPYLPHESCILDVSNFTGYVDLDGYELVRLFDKDQLEFSLFDDTDALNQLTIQLINQDALKFDYEYSDNEVEMFSDEDIHVPFSNHRFDVDSFVQCNS